MPYAQNVPAAERTLRLLEALAAAPNGLSASELQDELNISRSSLFALLNTLKARNYIEQNNDRGRYRAGPALYTLPPAQNRGLAPLIDAFHTDPELGLLNETVALAQLDGPDIVIVALRESRRAVRVVLDIGQRYPAQTAAAGQVLLAGINTTPDLEETRRQAVAQSQQEDVIEIAAPICADGHQPVAVLLVAIPNYRGQTNSDLPKTLRTAAARLSYRLGASIYQPYGHTHIDAVGPTTSLNSTEIDTFLQQAWGARLACIRSDGSPHVVPLWYEWDNNCFWVTASTNASWGQYVRDNADVSLTIDEPWPPLRRVLVTGQAELVTDNAIAGGITHLRQRLVTRYLGQNAAPTAMDQMQWQAFCITPKKIIGQRGLGS